MRPLRPIDSRRRVACAVLAALMGAAVPAAAQTGAYVGALGGVTFNTVSSGIVAGNGGVHLGRGLFVIGEVGRIGNVLPRDVADDIEDAEAFIEELTGLPVNLRLTVPATYGFGGVRWLAPGSGRVRPFLEGGLGVAHLTADIDASVGGFPLPEEILDQVDDVDLERNELLLTLGGGVTMGLTRAIALDAGYRYLHVSVEDDAPSIHTSVLYAGIRIGFGR